MVTPTTADLGPGGVWGYTGYRATSTYKMYGNVVIGSVHDAYGTFSLAKYPAISIWTIAKLSQIPLKESADGEENLKRSNASSTPIFIESSSNADGGLSRAWMWTLDREAGPDGKLTGPLWADEGQLDHGHKGATPHRNATGARSVLYVDGHVEFGACYFKDVAGKRYLIHPGFSL